MFEALDEVLDDYTLGNIQHERTSLVAICHECRWTLNLSV
jgi:hypothetical protein